MQKSAKWTRLFACRCAALLLSLATAAGVLAQAVPPVDNFAGKPRVAIITDMGNEPDDQMSFVRLLLYSNELDLEALVASTSTWQKSQIHPETMHTLVQAYAQVRTNLLLHAKDWPTADALDARIVAGQTGYGMAATGPTLHSAGSDALLRAMQRDDPRPLWICLWGGANTLAQALIDLRASTDSSTVARVVSRLRVSSISDQDDAGPWIRREFPNLIYVAKPSLPASDDYYAATWTGISGDAYYRNGEGADTSLVTNEWLDRNIRSKGPLGKVYPKFMFIMEGDTPSFLGLLDNGLNAYRRPDWGGWGGRYVWLQPYGETHALWTQGGDEFLHTTSQDAVTGIDGRTHVSDQATIWRWREAYQNDFAARMDWTVQDFAHANHAPQVVVNGQRGKAPFELNAKAGEALVLDASGTSDPDAQHVSYRWLLYPEAGLAGTHGATATLTGELTSTATLNAQSACPQGWLPLPAGYCKGAGVIHVILAVTDEGSPRLTSYRRIIVHVQP